MDWLFLGATVAAFGGGYYVHAHLSNLATAAATAVQRATTVHTSIPIVNTAVADVGKTVAGMVAPAAPAAAAPATATAALASLATLVPKGQ